MTDTPIFRLFGDAGMGIEDALPSRGLTTAELEKLRRNDRFNRVETVLEIDGTVLSMVAQVRETSTGLHCDHDTAEWHTTVSGDDFEAVLEGHEEWLDEDMDRVLEDL